MILITNTFTTPEENIACDEVLLMSAEAGEITETLRFWESSEYFVVLGRASKLDTDVNVAKCNEHNVKIVRRISGGGTVLQGPGCLNFSIVLSYDSNSVCKTTVSSYGYVLGKVRDALGGKGITAELLPVSDLAVGQKKISGNAQARKKKYFLHHGTLLYGFDISKIDVYLKHPPVEPEYRRGRDHAAFVSNISLSPREGRHILEDAIRTAFPVAEALDLSQDLMEKIKRLVRDKYTSPSWNFVF